MASKKKPHRGAPAGDGRPRAAPAAQPATRQTVRDSRPSLPLWRIKGSFTLRSPLHVGSGHDAEVDSSPAGDDAADPFIADVVRDSNGTPCIPGAALKGALRALARLRRVDEATVARLFGARDALANSTQAAQVEFGYAYLVPASLPGKSGMPGYTPTGRHAVTAQAAHGARDRDLGTPKHQALYLEAVVPPGCAFSIECHARGLAAADIGWLLALFQEAGSVNGSFRLGAGKAAGQGRVEWALASVKQFTDGAAIWTAAANATADLWASAPERKDRVQLQALPVLTDPPARVAGLSLKFHTPFLVYERQPRGNGNTGPHGKPRQAHGSEGILPASSLHGALRSQAEKVLRTLGLPAAPGPAAPPVREWAGTAALDLASVLFGAPGWRSVLQFDDFLTANRNAATLDHEMVAIDRVTGGGSDGAKFTIQALDCPVLHGAFTIDLRRLKLLDPGVLARALGLLLHVLRDLDEGDIPLGYGAAKGYGISTGRCADMLSQALAQPAAPATAAASLQAFSAWAAAAQAGAPAVAAVGPGGNRPADEEPASPLAHAAAPADGIFHNPYAFVPFGRPAPARWTAHEQIARVGHGHSRYDPTRLHGRIVCRLRATTPIFVGAGAENDTPPRLQKLFKLKQVIALPATSLRGMVSSLHEAITCSAPRVLEDRSYSVRQSAGSAALSSGSSSAIGRMHIAVDGQWHVEPLTVPTFVAGAALEVPYRTALSGSAISPHVYAKVLLEDDIAAGPTSDYTLSRQRCFGDALGQGYWYMPLRKLALDRNGTVQGLPADLRTVGPHVIGQRPHPPSRAPISEQEYQALLQQEPASAAGLVRGLIRAMNAPDGARPFPNQRNELFVPVPQELDAKPYLLRCLPSCRQRFEALADELFDGQKRKLPTDIYKRMPYTPIGRPRDDKALRPRSGDLVFFKPNSKGTAIAEVSFSSIWRGRVEVPPGADDVAAYSAARVLSGMSMHFAPLGSPARPSLLSPSELLFGAVEVRPAGDGGGATAPSIKAFASKLRFGFGRPTGDVVPLPTVTLKILSSPKPPSPAMYFKKIGQAQANYISKADLISTPARYELKGRKRYLHALRSNGAVQGLSDLGARDNAANKEPWRSRILGDNQQKVSITPLPATSEFLFEVDFHNLDQHELAALCASLDPHSSFEHKLGMGKPLGLGSAKVTLEGLYLVDRRARYLVTSFAAAPRYHGVWRGERPIDAATTPLPAHLRREAEAVPTPGALSASELARACMSELWTSNRAVFNGIVLTGMPEGVSHPVHYPQVSGANLEVETYKWFGRNDRGGGQWLETFTDASKALPTLKR